MPASYTSDLLAILDDEWRDAPQLYEALTRQIEPSLWGKIACWARLRCWAPHPYEVAASLDALLDDGRAQVRLEPAWQLVGARPIPYLRRVYRLAPDEDAERPIIYGRAA